MNSKIDGKKVKKGNKIPLLIFNHKKSDKPLMKLNKYQIVQITVD